MLFHAVLLSLLAATAQAVANPMVTPPPSLKKRFEIPGLEDAKDILSDASEFIGGAVSDVAAASACIDLVEDVLDADAPTPTGDDLNSAWKSALTDPAVTNMCLASVMPDSLTSSWSDYETELVSWYSSVSPTLQSAADACFTLPTGVQSIINSVLPCSTALEAADVTAVVFDGAPAETTGADTTAAGDDDGENAAPRATGVIAGAAAFAIGAAAVLL